MIIKKLVLLTAATAMLGGCGKQASDDTANTTANTAVDTAANATATTAVPAATRTRGVVQAIAADSVTLQTYDGKPATVPIDTKTGFAWVVKSDLASLKDGDFIGTATTGPDTALRAVELVIFPESMRGSGEGHYAWDVPGVVAAAGGGNAGSSAMTNGTVQGQSAMTNGTVQGQSAMTNGTVQPQSAMTNGTVTGAAGRPGEKTLTIAYKGGKAQVLVPAGTPVVRFEPTQRSVLAKGQKIFAVQTGDTPGAKFIAIGKDGVTPPM